ncbi:MAG: hypothetical protein Q7S92_01895, partial [Candidatus Diapherotrites archaeon]|nr:hypothetical protein [Candidatus Diapherotrites archaeon]
MTEIQIQTKSKFAVLAILFAFSYAILFALTFFSAILSSIPFLNALVPTTSWDSVTHWILPVVGFFGVYFLIEWGKDFFKSKFFASILFPITFLIASLISLFTAILFLYMPASINTGRQIILCAFDCPGLRAFYETSGKGGEIIF